MFLCGLCGRTVQMGAHRYDGTWVPKYEMTMCASCFSCNWDGIGPFYEKRFEAHLMSKQIPLPPRNSAGLYPRGK